MAVAAFTVTIGQALDGGKYRVSPGRVGAVSYTTFATDLATLVADGASPTQAHVTAVNNDWTTLKAQIDAQIDANVMLQLDTTAFTNMNQVRAALRALEQSAAGSGLFTA